MKGIAKGVGKDLGGAATLGAVVGVAFAYLPAVAQWTWDIWLAFALWGSLWLAFVFATPLDRLLCAGRCVREDV